MPFGDEPLSLGRLTGVVDAAVGPGSSRRDYEAAGVDFEERWKRFDEALVVLRALLRRERPPRDGRYYPVPSDLDLDPRPCQENGVPVWVGSWGSRAGLARVAMSADGWLASAYNTTPGRFGAARASLALALEARGKDATGFPNALATMWTWVTNDRAERDRVLADVLAPILRRDPGELSDQLCIGSVDHCAELLSGYAEAGCERVYLWPLGEERRQLELVASEVVPLVAAL
jgi:alkanesulfonate monooxygenase SsuD/methylene tetrahydromethanopterin reductase-like flavin-dependent oxidoreductase (luciferase family)